MVTTQRAEGYGPFPGGDPRRFSPDREVCTREEIERWEAACQAWREGRGEDTGPQCQVFGDGATVSGEGFGVGMYDFGEMPDDEAIEEIGRLEENIATMQQMGSQASLLLARQAMENARYKAALETLSSWVHCNDGCAVMTPSHPREHRAACARRIAFDALNPPGGDQ